MDLFTQRAEKNEGPLASRMRPRSLDEFFGQEHIIGEGCLLRRAITVDQLSSVIFYGPPGTGKTSLAHIIAKQTKRNYLSLNAVLSGVQGIRDAIENAEKNQKLYGKKNHTLCRRSTSLE